MQGGGYRFEPGRLHLSLIMVRINGYNTIKEVNRGGSSVIYQAADKSSGDTVAIKILTEEAASDSEERKMFEFEAELLDTLKENLFLDIYDTGEVDGRPYMILEYFDGRNVKNLLLQESDLIRRHWLTVGIKTAQALSALHLENIIHKDIKPENILVNETLDVRVIDFSIAEEIGFFSFDFFGSSGVSGTPTYMAPEQIEGDSLDYRTDMYSLGITLYEMASGEPPFVARTKQELLDKHRKESAEPLIEKREDISLSLSDTVMKMIEKDPDDRFSDMNMVLWELKKHWEPPKEEEAEDSGKRLEERSSMDIENRDTRLISPGSYLYCETRQEDSEYEKPGGSRYSIMNFSRGGLGFSSGDEFQEGEVVDCLIVIPAINSSFKTRGEVRWCRPSGDEDVERDEYSVGIKWKLLQKKYIEEFEKLKEVEETEIYY